MRHSDRPNSDATHAPQRARLALIIGLAVVLGFLAFGIALEAPFAFDDEASLIGNRSITALWPPSVPLSPPPDGTPVSGRPAVNVSFALNYALNRALGIRDRDAFTSPAAPIGYHIVNILIHVVTSLLLFAVIAKTIRGPGIAARWQARAAPLAAVAASVWLVHPLQTEAVDYLSQRTELLVSMCYTLVVYASIRAWDDPESHRVRVEHARRRWTFVAIAAALVGVASKEVIVTAPLMVLLYDRAFRASSWRQIFGASPAFRARRPLYLGLFACLVPVALTILFGARGETVGFGGPIRWWQYAASQAWAIAHYLRLALWPNHLTYDYGASPVTGDRVVVGLAVVTALVAGTLFAWTRLRFRWLGFLGAWFFLILAPSSSIIPIQTEIAAERRVYLALAAVVVALVIGADAAWDWFAVRGARTTNTWYLYGAWAVIVAACTIGSAERSATYRSVEGLWLDAIRQAPDNPRAFDNLATQELRAQPPRVSSADTLLRHAIALDSTYVPAINRLAAIAISEDQLTSARQLLSRSLHLAPRDSVATEQLGRTLLAMGQPDSALPYLEHVTARDPTASSLVDLGSAFLSSGQMPQAAATLRRALTLDSSRVDALSDLGASLVEQDSGAAAVPPLERAIEQEANASFDLAELGVAYAESGDRRRAVVAESLAVAEDPKSPAVYVFAGRALLLDGNATLASALFLHALSLAPTDPEAATRLAMARAAVGDRAGAARLIGEVLHSRPNYAFASRVADSLHLSLRP